MRKLMKYLLLAVVISLAGCTNRMDDGTITVKVEAVEQVSGYTYMLVKGKGPAYWVAAASMDIEPGVSITYQTGLIMEDFYSKELDRTFDKVMFLDAIQGSPSSEMGMMSGTSRGSDIITEKLNTSVEREEGMVSISEIYANPGEYEGKVIHVKGEVTKYNPGIMDRNWIHIQDGTEYEGKFDLTVTSKEPFQVGQVVTFEGVLSVDLDFGYGYTYEILLEEATAVQ